MMNFTSLIPETDRDEFYKLPDEARAQVEHWLPLMLEMAAALGRGTSKDRAAAEISRRSDTPGGSKPNIKYHFEAWRRLGWRGCYDQARWGALNRQEIELSTDAERKLFYDFVAAFFQKNQRKSKPGYRKFIRHWYSGGAVPGYGTWRDYWPKHGHPHVRTCPRTLPVGWSFENLWPKAKPTNVEFALVRQGTSAALSLLPAIPSTRDGLRPLEFVTFDDVQRDRKVCVPGYPIPCRLFQLGNRDTASARFLRIGLRPALPNECDENRKQALRLSDMKMLAAVTLMDYGYPKDYVSYWVLEHGTATLPTADTWALYQLSGGRIVCVFSMMEGGLVLAWDERGKGNSRAKAGHESDHNRLHNDSADQRGQIGKDRDNCPAAMTIMDKEARALARVQAMLPGGAAERLRMPYATLDEGLADAFEDLRRINSRRDHRLEGFQRTLEWRLKGELDWRTGEELEAWLAQIGKTFDEVEPLVDVNPRPRLETPDERWRRLCRGVEFIKPTFAVVRQFLDDHVLVKVVNGSISFTRDNVKRQYWPERYEDALPDYDDVRRQYLGWFVPGAMDWLILTTEDGGYVGTWKRIQMPHHNPEALAAAITKKTALLKKAIANVRRRDVLLPDSAMAGRNDDLDTNLRIMATAGLVSEKQLRDAGVATTEFPAPTPTSDTGADSETITSDHVAGGESSLAPLTDVPTNGTHNPTATALTDGSPSPVADRSTDSQTRPSPAHPLVQRALVRAAEPVSLPAAAEIAAATERARQSAALQQRGQRRTRAQLNDALDDLALSVHDIKPTTMPKEELE